ncbi:MAG: hypothetical protein RJA70_46 [Pseudomonadota bacterium]
MRSKVLSASSEILSCDENTLESVTESAKSVVYGFDVIGCGQVAHYKCDYKMLPDNAIEFSCRLASTYECSQQECLRTMPAKLRPQLESFPLEDSIEERHEFLYAAFEQCGCERTWCGPYCQIEQSQEERHHRRKKRQQPEKAPSLPRAPRGRAP